MMTPPRLGDGSLTLKLGDEEFTLKPSINAAQSLNARFDSLMSVAERVARLDFNVILEVVVLGLGPRYNSPKMRAQIADKIYQAGLTDDTGGVASVCAEYVFSLMRGGRPKSTESEVEAEEDPVGNAARPPS